jgi:hypothetical protein
MPLLIKRAVLLAKIESTYNSDPSPAAADAVLVESLSISHTGQRMDEQMVLKNTLAPDQQVFGGTLKQLQFSVPLKHSGTVDTAPEWGPILRACGCGETINAATSVVYTPATDSHDSVTIYYYEDGVLHSLTGCRGNVVFNINSGQRALMTFTMTGHDAGITDTSVVSSPTFDSTVAVAVKGASFSIGGYSAIISSMTMDTGNTIETPDDLNGSDGYGEIEVGDRDVNGTIDPEMVLVATNDFLSDWKNGTSMALATGTIGGTSGNQWALSLPAVSYRDMGFDSRGNIRTAAMNYGASESSGDDEFSLTLT